jgi:hypothetical protein
MRLTLVHSLPRQAVAATFGLCALLLAGCAAMPMPRIAQLSPPVLQQGKAASVEVAVEHWQPGTQVALLPAGPYVSHQLDLSAAPLALAGDGRLAYLAQAAGERSVLRVVDFPPDKRPRVLGQLHIAGRVTALTQAGQRLLVALAGGAVLLVDVTAPAVPRVLWQYQAPAEVRELQLAGKAVYLLLDGGALLQLASFGEPRLLQRWDLPLSARSMQVRGQRVWLAGERGLSVVGLGQGRAQLLDRYRGSGSARRVRLRDDLALLADGDAGLVVFDISQPDRLRWRGGFARRGAVQDVSLLGDAALLRLANGALLSMALDNPALPASGSAYHGEPPLALAVQQEPAQQGAVLIASADALRRVVMANSGATAISPEGVNLGGSRRGVIRDDILYVADWFSGLHLYDISDPRRPRHLSNYHTPGSSKGVALLGNYALVGDDDQGLQIVDVSDPRRPRWVAELPPEAMADIGLAYTMKLVGERLYLADHRGGFHIIDLSDIHQPRRLGGYDTPGKAWAIDVQGQAAFVADDSAGLLVFDVSDPATPRPIGQFDPGGQAEDVVLRDGLAYVAFFDKGLYLLDVRDPRHPQQVGHTPIPGNARGIELVGALAYVAGWESGLQVVDIRDPAAPRIIGNFDTDGAAWGVNVKGDMAYVLDWWGGIKVLDVSEPGRPRYVGRYHARDRLQQLRIHGSYVFAASGEAGLQVFDIKNPLNPIWATGVDLAGESRDVWLDEDKVYVAAGSAGVMMLDALDPFYTRLIARLPTPGAAQAVRAWNDYVYIIDSEAGLLVLDAREPRQPRTVAQYPLPLRDLWLDGHQLWAASDEGLQGWDIDEQGRLQQARRQAAPGGLHWVRAQDGLLLGARQDGELQLWRHSPDGFEALGSYPVGEAISDVQLRDQKIYVVGQRSGLLVLDIRDPNQPALAAVYPATGQHSRVALTGSAAFFAGEPRMASTRLLPAVTQQPLAGGRGIRLSLPADMPLGRYHLLLVAPDGRRRLQADALKVQLTDPARKRFNLDAMRRLLTAPLKSPDAR